MPLEDTPNFLQEDTERHPFQWIEDAGFDLHKSKLPSMDQVRAMTNAAFDAAAITQLETTINTPDVISQPTPQEVLIDFNQLPEKALNRRISGARADELVGRKPEPFKE